MDKETCRGSVTPTINSSSPVTFFFFFRGITLADKNTVVVIVAIAVIATVFGALFYYRTTPNWGNGGGAGSGANPTPTPPAYQQPTYPTYPPYPTAPPDNRAPTSLHVTLDPNPIDMGDMAYGTVTGDGYKYPITIHAKHVGANQEQTFNALLSEYGDFYHAETINIPGYWDFWATTDTGVTSNIPRLTVEGAMLTSSRTFFSQLDPFGEGYSTTLKLYCHSAGSATVFVNDGSSSTVIATVHINSGGYGEGAVDLGSFFSMHGMGTYEIDFTINGINASYYGESVFVTYSR